MTAIHTLTQRAMVLNLRIGYWQGNRLDKAASAEVIAAKGAKADAARVNKSLIPKEALAPIKATMNAIRAHFYEKTMPWRDNGDRLITRLLYLDFVPEHEKLVSAFREDGVAIGSGLATGDLVIVAGQRRLVDGQTVQAQPAAPPALQR